MTQIDSAKVIFKVWVNAKNQLKFKTNKKIDCTKLNLKNLRKYLYWEIMKEPPAGEDSVVDEDKEREYWLIKIPTAVLNVNKALLKHKTPKNDNYPTAKRERDDIEETRATSRTAHTPTFQKQVSAGSSISQH